MHNIHRFSFSIFVFLLISFNVTAQSKDPDRNEYRYWIYFKDKGISKPGDVIEAGSETYMLAKSILTDRALRRRGKVLPPDNVVGYHDLPVYVDYIKKLKDMGLLPKAVSRWFNAVSVQMDGEKLEKVKKLDFVEKIEGVHFLELVRQTGSKKTVFKRINPPGLRYNYGSSYWQNEQINVPLLHNYGITGFDVIVGMCDDGFNWRKHQALSKRKVLSEYDWIFKDDSVQNQFSPNQMPEDSWDQDAHGTSTLSTLGGFYEGQLIGPAFNSEFLLSKTEFGPTETPVEEDYWLEAVEWMESMGADVISSSLIYKPYDPPNNSYDYKDMDGKTTVIARAASFAVRLGVVVCNSMGNERQTNPPSIVSPPDGDSVLGIGAVDSTGIIAVFSSNGPTSDGRIKPDIVAMGVDVWTSVSETISWNDSSYGYSSGTSFSCPLTAGVCALILSAHPELTPMQVREALRKTADKSGRPDNVYGWGLVNAYEAALYHGIIMSNRPEISFEGDNIKFTIYVVSKDPVDAEGVTLLYSSAGDTEYRSAAFKLTEIIDPATNSGMYTASVKWVPDATSVETSGEVLKLYFKARDSRIEISSPYGAPGRFFYINSDTKKLELY